MGNKTTSATSLSVENGISGFELQRSKLNTFLEECQIQAHGNPWLEWAQASERTRQRYVERASEIISSVLKVVYPDDLMVICGLNCKLLQQLAKYWVMKQCVPHLIEAILKLWQKHKKVCSILVVNLFIKCVYVNISNRIRIHHNKKS